MIKRPFLFEATRMIARVWTGRSPTGIDRVCHAYLHNFGPRSQAVVQHRGVFRILSERHSDELFGMLADANGATRPGIAGLAFRAWAEGRGRSSGGRAIYLNVSHTDFDLPGHHRWVRDCGLRPVYFLHDLIPITHAQYCTPHATARHRGRVTGALKSAAGIVVNSRATARDLEAFARNEALPLPPLVVAPLGIAEIGKAAKGVTGDRPYFLCLGTIEERKNHLLLLEAWRRLIVQSGVDTPRLVIIGQWGAKFAAVREMLKRHAALRRYVTLITRCDDGEVRRWIAGAQALLMPTLAEGFGLPVAEALAIGTPVIASDLPCFREHGQNIPLLLDPHDPAAWTQAIASFSDAGGERQRQLQSMKHYRPPLWQNHFAVVEEWLPNLREQRNLAPPCDMPGGASAAAMTMRSGLARPSFRTIEAPR